MAAEQHCGVAVTAKIEEKGDILVPEQKDHRATKVGPSRVNGWIVVKTSVLERPHPVSGKTSDGKAAELHDLTIFDFHWFLVNCHGLLVIGR
jgi:hypothetical protein